MRIAFLCATILCLVACASPQTRRPVSDAGAIADQERALTRYALETRAAEYQRVYAMAERLRAANAELCPEREGSIGVMFETINDYDRQTKDAAREIWSLDERPAVIWVGADSPAAAAGVQIRDRLTSVNGRDIRPGRRATNDAVRQIRRAAQAGPVTLGLLRGNAPLSMVVSPVQRCGYDFVISDDPEINAAANGELIILNRGILRFARNDEEVSLVLAHELAHNAMHHVQAMRQNQTMGAIGGAALDILAAAAGVNTGGAFTQAGGDIGASMFSQDFESEADYVGMYFLARAGYSVDGVEDFWRRMAVENPQGVRLAYSHPTFAQRFVALPATRQEILAKVAAAEPLVPNMRRDAAATEGRADHN